MRTKRELVLFLLRTQNSSDGEKTYLYYSDILHKYFVYQKSNVLLYARFILYRYELILFLSLTKLTI